MHNGKAKEYTNIQHLTNLGVRIEILEILKDTRTGPNCIMKRSPPQFLIKKGFKKCQRYATEFVTTTLNIMFFL